MAEVHWLPAALDDLGSITFRIGVKEAMPDTAEMISLEIRNHCELCAEFPEMGQAYPKLGKGYRGFAHQRWLVVYRPINEGIEVLAVLDGARDFIEFFRHHPR